MTSKLASARPKRLKKGLLVRKRKFLFFRERRFIWGKGKKNEQINELAGPKCFYVRKSSVQKYGRIYYFFKINFYKKSRTKLKARSKALRQENILDIYDWQNNGEKTILKFPWESLVIIDFSKPLKKGLKFHRTRKYLFAENL